MKRGTYKKDCADALSRAQRAKIRKAIHAARSSVKVLERSRHKGPNGETYTFTRYATVPWNYSQPRNGWEGRTGNRIHGD